MKTPKMIFAAMVASLCLTGCGGGLPSLEPATVLGVANVLSAPNKAADAVIDGAAGIVHAEAAEVLNREADVAGCSASISDILSTGAKAIGVGAAVAATGGASAPFLLGPTGAGFLSVITDYAHCTSNSAVETSLVDGIAPWAGKTGGKSGAQKRYDAGNFHSIVGFRQSWKSHPNLREARWSAPDPTPLAWQAVERRGVGVRGG